MCHIYENDKNKTFLFMKGELILSTNSNTTEYWALVRNNGKIYISNISIKIG